MRHTGAVRDLGEQRYAELALRNIGEHVEYGDLRFQTPDEARRMVMGKE